MRRLYTFLFYLVVPFIIGRVYLKGRRLPAYRQRISERFSLGDRTHIPVDVWMHATSLGEVVAASPLIEAMLAKQLRVLVTTMTPTGSEQVSKRFGSQVVHQYIPYDLPWLLRRFFKKYNPRLGIIMETELWPNLINQAKRENVPLLLLNARLSDNAFKQYKIVQFMFKSVLKQFSAIFAQSDEDARRFMALGASVNLVYMLGNMKFDLQLPTTAKDERLQLKEKWGRERPVVIAASTHEGEEKQLVSHFIRLKKAIPGVVLLLVPRHPERFDAVFKMSVAHGFNTGRRSDPTTIDVNSEVVVVDAMGELMDFYQMSDYAFVGGSLVPVGGHNVLEPIAVGVPVFSGPYINNSKAICQDLSAVGAIVIVDNIDGLIDALKTMHENVAERVQQIANASLILAANRGTVKRYMEKIEVMLAL